VILTTGVVQALDPASWLRGPGVRAGPPGRPSPPAAGGFADRPPGAAAPAADADAEQQVARLVELHADDAATRGCDPRSLATALVLLATAASPASALAAGGTDSVQRIHRLLGPPGDATLELGGSTLQDQEIARPALLSEADLLPVPGGVPEGGDDDELVAVPLGGLAELDVECLEKEPPGSGEACDACRIILLNPPLLLYVLVVENETNDAWRASRPPGTIRHTEDTDA
jgi:hypothetical protein